MKRAAILTIVLLFPFLGVFAQTGSTGSTLNKKNLVVKEWNTNAKGVVSTLDHVTTFSPENDEANELVREFLNHCYEAARQARFEWGENGKVSRELVYDERNRLVNYKKFEYNEFGKKKVQYTYDAKGRLVATKLFEYITADD